MTFFDSTADLAGQLNGNGQKGMLQIAARPVESFWLRHCGQRNNKLTDREKIPRNVLFQKEFLTLSSGS